MSHRLFFCRHQYFTGQCQEHRTNLAPERVLPIVHDQAVETIEADALDEIVLGESALVDNFNAAVVRRAITPEGQTVISNECDTIAHQESAVPQVGVRAK